MWVELETVVTLRERTEPQALAGELGSLRGFAESLRTQAHEAANRLHTVISLIEIGRPEAVLAARDLVTVLGNLLDTAIDAVRPPMPEPTETGGGP